MNHRKYLLFHQRAVTLKNCILPTAQPLLCTMSHRFDKALHAYRFTAPGCRNALETKDNALLCFYLHIYREEAITDSFNFSTDSFRLDIETHPVDLLGTVRQGRATNHLTNISPSLIKEISLSPITIRRSARINLNA